MSTREWWLFVVWIALLSLAVIVCLLGLACPARSESAATVSWDLGTADPVALADVAGYRVRWRLDTSATWIVTDAGPATSARISGLPDHVLIWVGAQTYDFLGQTSRWTTAVPYCTCATVP